MAQMHLHSSVLSGLQFRARFVALVLLYDNLQGPSVAEEVASLTVTDALQLIHRG
jgi:hypothetical protein